MHLRRPLCRCATSECTRRQLVVKQRPDGPSLIARRAVWQQGGGFAGAKRAEVELPALMVAVKSTQLDERSSAVEAAVQAGATAVLLLDSAGAFPFRLRKLGTEVDEGRVGTSWTLGCSWVRFGVTAHRLCGSIPSERMVFIRSTCQ
jgi:hypothetical protein